MKRIYAITTTEGDVLCVPAEVIADNYARHYESCGESYQENFDSMLNWFDINDFEFADWAKNNMDWDDVKDKAFLVRKNDFDTDFQEAWVNGEYEYIKHEIDTNEDLISRKELIEEIKSLRVTIIGARAEKGMLDKYMNDYKDSILRIINEQKSKS